MTFAVKDGGGVHISGTADELRALAAYLRQAADVGRIRRPLFTDGARPIEIVRTD